MTRNAKPYLQYFLSGGKPFHHCMAYSWWPIQRKSKDTCRKCYVMRPLSGRKSWKQILIARFRWRFLGFRIGIFTDYRLAEMAQKFKHLTYRWSLNDLIQSHTQSAVSQTLHIPDLKYVTFTNSRNRTKFFFNSDHPLPQMINFVWSISKKKIKIKLIRGSKIKTILFATIRTTPSIWLMVDPLATPQNLCHTITLIFGTRLCMKFTGQGG